MGLSPLIRVNGLLGGLSYSALAIIDQLMKLFGLNFVVAGTRLCSRKLLIITIAIPNWIKRSNYGKNAGWKILL